MTTRPYADCKTLTLALCGIPDANGVESVRIDAFLNSRARKAYAASQYWPRWLNVEERVCTEDGLIPYAETGLDTIKTVMRIHRTEPFQRCDAGEYTSFAATTDGIQIAGYCPREVSDFRAPMLVAGTVFPNLNGTYQYSGMGSTGADGTTTAPNYQSASNEANTLTAGLSFTLGTPPVFIGYQWNLRGTSGSNYWRSDTSTDYTTPELASGTYTAQGSASDAGVTITKITTYSAWVTYKAALTVTYGTGDGQTADVPEEWWEYMAHGAYADFLRNDGQQEKGALAEVEAQSWLDEQLEQIDRQSGTHVFTRVMNHGNTQAR